MAIIGLPDSLTDDLKTRSAEELEIARQNILQLSVDTMFGGIVTEDENLQAESILAAIENEIRRRADKP